jgi:hypothetical protein
LHSNPSQDKGEPPPGRLEDHLLANCGHCSLRIDRGVRELAEVRWQSRCLDDSLRKFRGELLDMEESRAESEEELVGTVS